MSSLCSDQKKGLCFVALLKKSKDDEGRDVERLPIMGTTTALRPGELWQLLAGSSTFRFAAQARRLHQSGDRREESANQRTGPGKL